MKITRWLVILLFLGSGLTMNESCKNKKTDNTTQENTTKDAPVVVNTDTELRSSVNGIVKDYSDVKAEVNDGVITLRGTIKKEDLQHLVMRVQELKPKKVENELVVK